MCVNVYPILHWFFLATSWQPIPNERLTHINRFLNAKNHVYEFVSTIEKTLSIANLWMNFFGRSHFQCQSRMHTHNRSICAWQFVCYRQDFHQCAIISFFLLFVVRFYTQRFVNQQFLISIIYISIAMESKMANHWNVIKGLRKIFIHLTLGIWWLLFIYFFFLSLSTYWIESVSMFMCVPQIEKYVTHVFAFMWNLIVWYRSIFAIWMHVMHSGK